MCLLRSYQCRSTTLPAEGENLQCKTQSRLEQAGRLVETHTQHPQLSIIARSLAGLKQLPSCKKHQQDSGASFRGSVRLVSPAALILT